MDAIRRILGVMLLVGLPPAVLYWMVVHPFVGFWRRVGPRAYRRRVPALIPRLGR